MFFRLHLNATKLVKRADLNAELSAPLVKSHIADPPLRRISLMGMLASACLMNPMICYSLNWYGWPGTGQVRQHPPQSI
jgi:hypothetical protein